MINKNVEVITGIVLAGGASSRMGTDKGLVEVNGLPMVQHVLDTLGKVCAEILIVTNNSEYEQFEYPLVEDKIKGKGPLMGIICGLEKSNTKHNLIVSCDTPFVSEYLLRFIFNEKEESDIVIAKKGGRLHPLIGYYQKGVLPALEEKLTLNELKVISAIGSLKFKEVDCENFADLEFKNINRITDI